MIKLNDFINRLELALKEPSKYQSGGWGKWDGKYWNWDCICLIKGILWGWKNDKTKEDFETNDVCPRCGGTLVKRNGKYGTFMGCSNYPKCRYIKKIV